MLSNFSMPEQREVTPGKHQGVWAAVHPSCAHVCTHSLYWASRIGPTNKCSAGFEHQQHIFFCCMRNQLRFSACCLQGFIEQLYKCPTAPSTWPGRDSLGAWPRRRPVWVFDCAFRSAPYSGTQLALFCTGMSGAVSDQPEVCQPREWQRDCMQFHRQM